MLRVVSCVVIKEEQKMADLPTKRLEVAPLFNYIDIDVFGPWKARGGAIVSKRRALMIPCLLLYAVHIEIYDKNAPKIV